MKITRRQLRRIIKESMLREQAGPNQPTGAASAGEPPLNQQDAVAMGSQNGGRPDLVIQDVESFRADGLAEDIIGAYMAGFQLRQAEMDMWYDDVEGYYPGKLADDVAKQLGITIPKLGSIIN